MILIFTPSPNISVGQEAVFNCYSPVYLEPAWYINGETLDHPSNADRSDITVIGYGTSNITLIIDGLIENDRTTVQCTAFGLANGSPQFFIVLYIHYLFKVSNLINTGLFGSIFI